MNCENASEQFTEWLSNQLPDAERLELEAHMAICPDCQQEAQEMQHLWQRLGTLPVPKPAETMRIRFDAMLDDYKEAVKAEQQTTLAGLMDRFRTVFAPSALMLRVAYGLILLGVGMGLGYWFHDRNSGAQAYQQQIDTLSLQVQEMRQMMLLSLIESPAASERLRAVSYTNDIGQANERVIEALFMTLNNDANVNVRLVTLEALARLANDPAVREGLVQSLSRQDSPLVQVALADVMVKLQEKRSVRPLRKLLQQENLNDLVKSKIQQTIKELS